MTINAQSGTGKIRLFEDFCGAELLLASTVGYGNIGPFKVGGVGMTGTDGGVPATTSDGLSGVGKMTSSATDKDTCCISTSCAFDVALMGTIILEARVRFVDLDAKAAFIGFSNATVADMSFEDVVIDQTAAGTIENTATNLVGFYLSSEATDHEDWHSVYQGGTATAVTTCTDLDLQDEAVAGDFQVLRLEIDNNGTTRWYIDGVLLKTLVGAASTTTDMSMNVVVAANSAEAAIMDVDYILVEANRDWNA